MTAIDTNDIRPGIVDTLVYIVTSLPTPIDTVVHTLTAIDGNDIQPGKVDTLVYIVTSLPTPLDTVVHTLTVIDRNDIRLVNLLHQNLLLVLANGCQGLPGLWPLR